MEEGSISFILAEANFNRRCPTKAVGSTPFIPDEANFNGRCSTLLGAPPQQGLDFLVAAGLPLSL